jgi:hypothetical protein
MQFFSIEAEGCPKSKTIHVFLPAGGKGIPSGQAGILRS